MSGKEFMDAISAIHGAQDGEQYRPYPEAGEFLRTLKELGAGLLFPWNKAYAGNGFGSFANLDEVMTYIKAAGSSGGGSTEKGRMSILRSGPQRSGDTSSALRGISKYKT